MSNTVAGLFFSAFPYVRSFYGKTRGAVTSRGDRDRYVRRGGGGLLGADERRRLRGGVEFLPGPALARESKWAWSSSAETVC